VKTLTIFIVVWAFRQTVLVWALKERLLYSDGSKMTKEQTSAKQQQASLLPASRHFFFLLLTLQF
jgi:hypothetical protein